MSQFVARDSWKQTLLRCQERPFTAHWYRLNRSTKTLSDVNDTSNHLTLAWRVIKLLAAWKWICSGEEWTVTPVLMHCYIRITNTCSYPCNRSFLVTVSALIDFPQLLSIMHTRQNPILPFICCSRLYRLIWDLRGSRSLLVWGHRWV